MVYNICLYLALLCVGVVRAGVSREVYEGADDLDRQLIADTGCKYVQLKKNETIWLSRTDVQNTIMAGLLSDEELRGNYRETLENGFETHFAVRSAGELQVLMVTGRRYADKRLDSADYKVGFGSRGNIKSFMAFVHSTYKDDGWSASTFKDANTDKIMSPDSYTKLYVKIDNDLRYGKQCEKTSIDFEESFTNAPLEIVYFGFYSLAEEGAKVLYDCPYDFANCACDWVIYA